MLGVERCSVGAEHTLRLSRDQTGKPHQKSSQRHELGRGHSAIDDAVPSLHHEREVKHRDKLFASLGAKADLLQ